MTEIDVLTTERDNALLRAEELEHQLRRKVEDCGCDGQAYDDIRAERDAARDAVAAMTVEIADLRAELVAMAQRKAIVTTDAWPTSMAAPVTVRRINGQLVFIENPAAALDPVVTADAGEGSAVTTAGEVDRG